MLFPRGREKRGEKRGPLSRWEKRGVTSYGEKSFGGGVLRPFCGKKKVSFFLAKGRGYSK